MQFRDQHKKTGRTSRSAAPGAVLVCRLAQGCVFSPFGSGRFALFSSGSVWSVRCKIDGMNILTRCLNLLDQRGIHYARSIHEGSKAAPSQRLAQTVVYRGDNGFGMLVLQPDAEVDFGEVRRLMGLTETRLATESELDALFPDCEPDA